MKDKELSIFSLSKITTYEILIEEQLERLESVRFRYYKRYLSSQESLKKRFILSKIIGAIIFGVLPIIPLLTYFKVLDFINEGSIPIELILFAGSLLFGIFFLFQFFNFFLMAMLNTMKILSGSIFEWFETLPISRGKLKRLIFLTIIRSLDIPLIVITVSFPIIMLIGTQNLSIFFICIGVSIIITIFSFSILILFSERMNRILNVNDIGSKRTHIIRLINLISYIIIVIGSVFLIQWALGSIESFFVLFARSPSPAVVILILSMIPFPIAPGYLISSFIAPHQIPFQLWYNIIIGFALFLILTWFIYQQSVKGVKKTSFSKFKKKYVTQDLVRIKSSVKISVKSPIWAHIRKDLIIFTRNLKNFLSIVMPIVIGFIFTFAYDITTFGRISPPEIAFILNLFVIIGFNIVISGMIVFGILNMEESGASLLASLPIIPRDQAKAKLILMSVIQTIAVLTPSFMYIGNEIFLNSILTALCAIPFVLLLLILMFEMRVYLFGKAKNYFVIEEVFPEKKIGKWLAIFIIEYFIYFLILSLAFNFYLIPVGLLMELFLITFFIVGFILIILIFLKMFPSERAEIKIERIRVKAPITHAPNLFIEHPWSSILVLLILNFLFRYIISFIPPPQYPPFVEASLSNEIYKLYYLFAYNIIYGLLWIIINPLILGVPMGDVPIKKYLKKVTLGEVESISKKIIFSILISIIIIFLNYLVFFYAILPYVLGEWLNYIIYYLILDFFSCFWQQFAFLGVIFVFFLREFKNWKAIIFSALLYSISHLFYLLLTQSITLNFLYLILIESSYMFLTGLLFAYVYMKTENLILIGSIVLSFNTLYRFFISYILVVIFIYPQIPLLLT